MKINVHNVVEVREQITHYTNNLKFICRNIIVVDERGNEIEISLFTEQDERAVQPLTTQRSYHNA
jgi:hypothetical protein